VNGCVREWNRIKELREVEMQSLLIKTTGEISDVTPAGGKFSLKELQAHVGGYIEVVRVEIEGADMIMICNEEGLLMGLPYNICASDLSGLNLVGDVVLAPDSSLE
jgi:hypothetical protein